MSALSDLAGFLAEILDAADQAQRQRGIEREATTLERFAEDLVTNDPAVRRTGPGSLHRGDADLVYLASVIQLDGHRILEEAEREVTALGGTFKAIEPSTEEVMRFVGKTASSSIRGWVLPQRGWVLLISAAGQVSADAFANMLDARLRAFEHDGS
jgi:hypothetical protein